LVNGAAVGLRLPSDIFDGRGRHRRNRTGWNKNGSLFVDPDEVVDSASFIDDLGPDSLDMVELALKFEREFGFEISDDAAESILTSAVP
jgi:acyl carrier protein